MKVTLKNEDDIKNEDDLKNEDILITEWGKVIMGLGATLPSHIPAYRSELPSEEGNVNIMKCPPLSNFEVRSCYTALQLQAVSECLQHDAKSLGGCLKVYPINDKSAKSIL